MLGFNAHQFGDTLRAQLHTLSRTGRVVPRLNEIAIASFRLPAKWPAYPTSGSSRLALHDSGSVLGHVKSPDLG